VRVLVAPALPALPLLGAGDLLDVGSGNGSPGLVLALLQPRRPATLLEPRAKRWAFLREVTRSAGREDVRVLRARHDTYAGPAAANVTLRGLRLSLPALEPLVEQGGRVLAFGVPPAPTTGWREASSAGPGGPAVFVRTD
jgi:16S rRNA G527 N7-methylase RsmG